MRSRGNRVVGRIALALMLVVGVGLPGMAAPGGDERAAQAAGAPVDLNRASTDELQSLPGIGPVTAERIVTFRKEHGPFRRVEDLMKVKGIGEKSFQKLRSRVKVTDES